MIDKWALQAPCKQYFRPIPSRANAVSVASTARSYSKAESFGISQFPQNLEPRHLDSSEPQPSHCIARNHGSRLNPRAHFPENAPAMAFSKDGPSKASKERVGHGLIVCQLAKAVSRLVHLSQFWRRGKSGKVVASGRWMCTYISQNYGT